MSRLHKICQLHICILNVERASHLLLLVRNYCTQAVWCVCSKFRSVAFCVKVIRVHIVPDLTATNISSFCDTGLNAMTIMPSLMYISCRTSLRLSIYIYVEQCSNNHKALKHRDPPIFIQTRKRSNKIACGEHECICIRRLLRELHIAHLLRYISESRK